MARKGWRMDPKERKAQRQICCHIHGIAPRVGTNRCLRCYNEARKQQRTEAAIEKLQKLGGKAKPKQFTQQEFLALRPAFKDFRIMQRKDGTIVLLED